MSDKPRIEMHRGDEDMGEIPLDIKERLVYLMEWARAKDFSILCAVSLNHETKHLSAFFAPWTSQNPHLDSMCDDLAEMFHLMAKRIRQ